MDIRAGTVKSQGGDRVVLIFIIPLNWAIWYCSATDKTFFLRESWWGWENWVNGY